MVLLFVLAGTASAGKNSGGALVVHTADNAYFYRYYTVYCDSPYYEDPGACWAAGTEVTDGNTPVIFWVLAAFRDISVPCVSGIDFGVCHNLPEEYVYVWNLCGPDGTTAVTTPGWPSQGNASGISIGFGTPVIANRLFPVYWFATWGFEGAYFGTCAHPDSGVARFWDDSEPPVADECHNFGQIRWYEEGFNHCPDPAACCLPDYSCVLEAPGDCEWLGGEFLGGPCDPNPCIPSDVPEMQRTQETTWGKTKAIYR
jgi:hypothetical protein